VLEVRRQFKENPDIMTYKAKPDYERCVSLVTQAALREMQYPAMVCIVTPIFVGILFRYVGECTGRPLLGAEVLASYLMFATVTGILMALFLDTAVRKSSWKPSWNFAVYHACTHKCSVLLGRCLGQCKEVHRAG
jgi:Na+/H+-translocating membrane pyrophosphatase